MSPNEPRALTAALQSPAFVTKGGGLAMHAANRHVERWAPEEGASRIRPLRNLGFVDRLVTPWIESAQRSASLRMFTSVIASGVGERNATNVSWVFPRPWYQDELDWMAAARQVGGETAMHQASAPSMLTTRGTYVAPVQAQSQIALPAQLHEYIAPSLSVARPDVAVTAEAYSPLVPFAAANAAHVMARAVAPIVGDAGAPRMSPGLRAVLTTMLERATRAPGEMQPSRVSTSAPELVTPPAPRAEIRLPGSGVRSEQAEQVAETYAEQYARVAEVQRMARLAAEREMAARAAAHAAQPQTAAAPQPTGASTAAQMEELRAVQQKAIEQRQAEIQRRMGDAHRQQDALRLHEQSRDAAARDARIAAKMAELAASQPTTAAPVVETRAPEQVPAQRVAEEVAAAVASLPPELASMVTAGISARPERAVQAIAELGEALRSVELIARSQAAGGTFEATRGPRLVMPAGLGGLVSTVQHTTGDGAQARMPAFAALPAGAMPATAAPIAARAPIAATMRVPSLPFISAPRAATMPAPTSALGAATQAMPAALSHVAWSDRWLARFAGATPRSLEVLAASSSPSGRVQILADMAPHAVFVAPMFEERSGEAQPRGGFDVGSRRPEAGSPSEPLPTLRGGPAPSQPVVRFADDAETPDEMFAAIAMSASRARSAAVAPPQPPRPTLPAIDPDRYVARETLADLVAHAAPSAPGAGLSAQLASSPFAAALRHVLPLGSAPAFDVRSLFGANLSATYLAGLLSSASHEISIAGAMPAWASWGDAAAALEPATRAGIDFSPTYVAPGVERAVDADSGETREQLAGDAAQLTTLRSALLSWDVETLAATGAPIETRVATASTPLARTMIDSIALPMLGDTAAAYDAFGDATHATTYAAPGMIAERAQAWSVAQERSSSDLAFDFVTPELVLAARVYGLGPAEAAQAARLAVAGPGQLTAMAGAVDRTFVQAMAIEAERRGDRSRVVTAYPLAAGDVSSAREPDGGLIQAAFAPSRSTFGIERRAPRGAFLWPAGTTAALGMNAAAPDGEQSMSVAALELLAAQAVAELGTYTALSPEVAGAIGGEAAGASASTSTSGSEADALEAASALVPSARREKFQALYVALGQSPAGRTWSPAARAARALALAGRGDDSVSARERAMVAWDVLPVVYGVDESEPVSTGDAAARAVRRRDELRALDASFGEVFVDGRPGLGNLSARAGEALGSYVTPTAHSSSSSSSREVGAVLRAPTAAQELVQTGRPAARTGGGEVEIPAWFEQAARKMFESQSSVSDGISLAELTLVTAAPSSQIAASSRTSGASAPVAVAPSAAAGAENQQIDIEKLANDVYREVVVLMDLARARNGEPYQ